MLGSSIAYAAFVISTIDHPDATDLTDVWGIDGQGRLVGNYVGTSGWQSYIFDGTVWLNPGTPGTVIGADEDKIIGNYFPSNQRGFVLDSSGRSDVEFPGAANTEIYDIDGSKIVGKYYPDGGSSQGFLFDGSSWSTINVPGAIQTIVTGVDGNVLAGNFLDSVGWHGFLYDGTDWTIVDSPSGEPTIWGIQGDTVVGFYDSHGFLYDGITWTLIDIPGAIWTQATGIDGNTVFGKYADESNITHGFVAEIPEPVTIDIKPDSVSNRISIKSKGVIPVAILTTDTFDATQVDWETVTFGPDGATESHGRSHVEDVDSDGDMDFLLHFDTQDTGIQCGDTDVTLTGQTFDGRSFTGSDAIEIVACH
jgi:hypothetical protein